MHNRGVPGVAQEPRDARAWRKVEQSTEAMTSMKPGRFCFGVLVLLITGLVACASASAQSTIAALVNDEPISTFDVAQRQRLMEATGQKASKQEVIENLIEERVKLQESRRLRIQVAETDVERAYQGVAERVRMTPSQLTAALGQMGVNPNTLRNRIRADAAWRKVVQARLRSTVRVREADVLAALHERNKDGKGKIVEYSLQQIIFVIPQNAGSGYAAQRRQEAESLRSRFVSCAETLPKVRGLKDVVVRELGRKRSDDLSKDVREMLADVAPNKLAKVNVTSGGAEVIAVCDRREIEDDNAGEKQIRDALVGEEMQSAAKRLLGELRKKAVVEIR